jgi:hypothetical protein
VRDAMLRVSQRGFVGLNLLVATAGSREPTDCSVYKGVNRTKFGVLGLRKVKNIGGNQ